MEILAPAGSKESFVAAIKAGANAVYVGIKNFNARKNANNLNFYDLEVLTNYAHENNVKVYITFNTLIKHEEINDAVAAIDAFSRLKIDAMIVQDLGIARIIKEYYPSINLHASTQLAVHNSLGVDALAAMDFKRVVLARELTFAELKTIKNHSPLELEIFAHGALCFCVSGMCLFSSVIGGYSGNRGLCTQPCRRIWQTKDKSGYLFSPRDLELAEYINKIKNIGISSIKIEGRMRSSEYVYRTTKAYRMLVDAKDSEFDDVLKDARKLLAEDYAREKSTCLFSGRDESLFEINKSQCLGKNIGNIVFVDEDKFGVVTNEEIKLNDRLRISKAEVDKTFVLKVKSFVYENDVCVINEKLDASYNGASVFIASSSVWDEKIIKKELDMIYSEYNKNISKNKNFSNEYTSLIARVWDKNVISQKEYFWVRIDRVEWLDILKDTRDFSSIIVSINKTNFYAFKNYILENGLFDKKFIIELDPFINERDSKVYREFVSFFVSKKIKTFVLNNISHLKLVPDDCKKIAGSFLYVWNAYAALNLKEFGVDYYFSSWEDDILNIRRMAGIGLGSKIIVSLFGYPAIVRSRMLAKDLDYGDVLDDKNLMKFVQFVEGEMNVLRLDKPVSLFNFRDKLKNFGINNFCIDLSYVDANKKFLSELLSAFYAQENFSDSFKFNFKRGIS